MRNILISNDNFPPGVSPGLYRFEGFLYNVDRLIYVIHVQVKVEANF